MKRRIVVYAVLLSIIAVWLFFYHRVNSKYPESIEMRCPRGETVIYEELQYEITGCEWLDDTELRTRVGRDEEDILDCNYQAMVVQLNVTNTAEEEKEYSLYECCVEGCGYTNGISSDLVATYAGENQLSGTLEPGESITVWLPYLCAETMVRNDIWKDLKNQEFVVIVSLYPQKTALLVQ